MNAYVFLCIGNVKLAGMHDYSLRRVMIMWEGSQCEGKYSILLVILWNVYRERESPLALEGRKLENFKQLAWKFLQYILSANI